MSYERHFEYPLSASSRLTGSLALGDLETGQRCYREGRLSVDGGRSLPISLTHSPATERLMYGGEVECIEHLRTSLREMGVELPGSGGRWLPGPLLLGSERTRVTQAGVLDCMRSPAFEEALANRQEGEVVVLPVLREGMKYGLQEAVCDVLGAHCDEVVVDAHHVPDESVPYLGRRMELSVFKDADLTLAQREKVKVAILGDSVASGTVIIGLIEVIKQRFPNVERIELVAPLAAVYGLARIAAFGNEAVPLRAHVFESLLNALPPEYYFSPFFPEEEMHMAKRAYSNYRDWWGVDKAGKPIAETACAGYGWSEAFFNPRKQIAMIDEQLRERHGMGLAEVLGRY
ncbi:phosphoribosyltransferase [Pelagicoccus sp. SDUM812003]|uniref:phosphoribosyltransferase n=1 Tax=Pelagicoccus sp. SDUM812003 TaxID=3041267 RepID=UPI00280F769A|nr:phosphoribosyltransferase [Pelagicoccus sp. SDUM812003]MDQ8202494.1 phosphoribosyltransferase [Pelagicoccus sp. SDUM812003]